MDHSGWLWTVVVAAVVALSTMVVRWLCGRCRRRIELRRLIAAEAEELYTFLSDPHNLVLIHPKTTEIRVEEEKEEGEGGGKRIQFVWVEKVPFTVQSLATLTSDPSTLTVVFDIIPAGAMFEVQLRWRCTKKTSEAADDTSGSANRDGETRETEHATRNSPTDSPRDETDAAAAFETDHATSRMANDNSTIRGDHPSSSAANDQTTSGKGKPFTLFKNEVIVTGPRAIAVPVALFTLKPVQNTLTDNLQQHFLKEK